MGADLYIRSVHDEVRDTYTPLFEAAVKKRDDAKVGGVAVEEAQQAVEEIYGKMMGDGYFRDSYNATGVLQYCGLSWWEDVMPLCDGDGLLLPSHVKTLIGLIEANPLILPTADELRSGLASVSDTGDDSLEGWHRYFTEKRGRLLAFLQQAVDLDEAIDCSL